MTVDLIGCPLCGDDSRAALDAMEGYANIAPEAAVCGSCATIIANVYSKKHSDKWLTWPEEPTPHTRKKMRISQSLRTQVFERDEYRCLRCGTHLSLRVDHIIPECEGGEAELNNLQTLCAPCNSWKGTRTIDFRGKRNE